MHFPIDASLPRYAAVLLRRLGYGATDVRDAGMRDAPDETIVQYAKSNHPVLVTRDFDFADHAAIRLRSISVSWCSTHRKYPIREPSRRTDIQPPVARQRPLRGG